MVKVCTLSFPRNDVCQRDGGGLLGAPLSTSPGRGVLGAPLSTPPGRGVLGENSTCTWLCCRLVYTVDGVVIGHCQQLRSQSIGTIALHMRRVWHLECRGKRLSNSRCIYEWNNMRFWSQSPSHSSHSFSKFVCRSWCLHLKHLCGRCPMQFVPFTKGTVSSDHSC